MYSRRFQDRQRQIAKSLWERIFILRSTIGFLQTILQKTAIGQIVSHAFGTRLAQQVGPCPICYYEDNDVISCSGDPALIHFFWRPSLWSILSTLRHGLSVRQLFLHAVDQSSFLCHCRSSFGEFFLTDYSIISPLFCEFSDVFRYFLESHLEETFLQHLTVVWMSCKIICRTQWLNHCKISSTIAFDPTLVFIGITMRYVATWSRQIYFSHEDNVIRHRPTRNFARIASRHL